MENDAGTYVKPLGTVVLPAAGGEDVGLLGRGMEAFYSEGEHGVAQLRGDEMRLDE